MYIYTYRIVDYNYLSGVNVCRVFNVEIVHKPFIPGLCREQSGLYSKSRFEGKAQY